MLITVLKVFVLIFAITMAIQLTAATTANHAHAQANFILTSTAFENGAAIPARYTCEGASSNVSPALAWSGAPQNTKSFALLAHDPDAPDPENPKTDWVHWIVFNIPASTAQLAEGITSDQLSALKAYQCLNGSGNLGYDGPCPPIGTHRYFFELYALSTEIDCPQKSEKLSVEKFGKLVEKTTLDKATLMGTYKKK